MTAPPGGGLCMTPEGFAQAQMAQQSGGRSSLSGCRCPARLATNSPEGKLRCRDDEESELGRYSRGVGRKVARIEKQMLCIAKIRAALTSGNSTTGGDA